MKEWILYLLFISAFIGGVQSFWTRVHGDASRMFGCMRYTYDVVVWRHFEDEMVRHQLTIPNLLDTKTERAMGQYLAKRYPEYIPFSVVSITLAKKNSVMFETFCDWLYRACTRTADDAVREWKEEHGMAV